MSLSVISLAQEPDFCILMNVKCTFKNHRFKFLKIGIISMPFKKNKH